MSFSGLNFNGWGNKQTHAKDALVASRLSQMLGLPSVHIKGLVTEVSGVA